MAAASILWFLYHLFMLPVTVFKYLYCKSKYLKAEGTIKSINKKELVYKDDESTLSSAKCSYSVGINYNDKNIIVGFDEKTSGKKASVREIGSSIQILANLNDYTAVTEYSLKSKIKSNIFGMICSFILSVVIIIISFALKI